MSVHPEAPSDFPESVLVIEGQPQADEASDASTEHVRSPPPQRESTGGRWANLVDEGRGRLDVHFQIRQLQDIVTRFQMLMDQSNSRHDGELQRLGQRLERVERPLEELRLSRDVIFRALGAEEMSSWLAEEKKARRGPVMSKFPEPRGFTGAHSPAQRPRQNEEWAQAHEGHGGHRRRNNGPRARAGTGDAGVPGRPARNQDVARNVRP